jgi:hypothetical protein
MKARTLLTSILALAMATACGASEDTSKSTADNAQPVEAAKPAETEQPPAAPIDEAEAAPAALSLEVASLTGGKASGPVDPATLSAAVRPDALSVKFENLAHYCDPKPSFTAVLEGATLKISVTKPEGPVTRCFGPYAGELTISHPKQGEIKEVVIVSHDGNEIARGPMSKNQ